MDEKLLDTANVYGSNLQMISYLQESGSEDVEMIDGFKSAAKFGQESLIGRYFPKVNAAIEAGRNEVKNLFNNFYAK